MTKKTYTPRPRRYWRKNGTGKKGASIQEAIKRFFISSRGQERFHLLQLWDNWPMVMGEDLSEVALPLGAKENTLIVGAEDNMILHELSFQANEIIERANAFMNAPVFKQVRLELMQGRKALYPRLKPAPGLVNLPDKRVRPAKLGALKEKVDPNSPAGQAYLAYIASFDEK